MIWKILSATVAVFLIVTVYYAISPAANTLGNNLVASSWGSLTIAGLSLSGFVSNTYNLFGIGIVISLIFVAAYLVAGANSPEEDEGTL